MHPAPAFPPNASCVRAAPGAGGVTLDHDRLDLGGVDLTGLSREDVLAALTDAALEAFDELGPADFADGDPSGHWVTLEEGEHVFIHGGKVYATREAIEHLARGKPPPDTPAPHHPLRPVGKGRAPAPEKSPAPAPKAKPPAAKAAGAGGFDPHAEAQAIHDLVGRHVAAVHAGAEADEGGRGGGIGRKYPRMDAAHEAARREVEAHVADLVARAPTAIALRDVVRAYGLPAARGSKESLAQQLRDVLRQRMAASVRVYASADHEPDPSEAHFAAPLRPVRFTPYRPDAEFYSPDEPRDPAGRWAAGGAGGTKAERSAARVERKRAEKAADRQESGRAKNRNDALAAAHEEIVFTHGSMPKLMGADGYHLHQAVRAVHPNSLRGKPLREKAAAFRRLRDEATRAAAGLRRDPAAQPHLTGDRRANALNGLREIARRADRALGLIRREATSRRLPGVQSAQFGSADAEFYSPDQPRDDRGRWTAGGGEGAAPRPTQADRAALRQSSLTAVRAYVRAGGEPTHVEHEQLAAHLARLTVDQLHAVKVEHGLKASGRVKSDLVARLAERFRLHRAKQEPAGKKALTEAVAGREGWHAPRDVMGGHAALHGPTGARVRADSAGTMFDVLAPGSELHSSHATAGEAVRAAETSNRFGTGGTTAEREHAARQEAIAKSRERAAQAQKPTTAEKPFAAILNHPKAQNLTPEQQEHLRSELSAWKQRLGDHYAGTVVRTYGGGTQVEVLKTKYGYHGKETARAATFPLPDQPEKPPAAAPPAPVGGGKQPHEMTREEYARTWHAESQLQREPWQRRSFDKAVADLRAAGGTERDVKEAIDLFATGHRRLVEEALTAGKHVPAHVLADYPDLARAHARFDAADAPLRPVRFVPLVQPPPAAEFAPGGQEDACR